MATHPGVRDAFRVLSGQIRAKLEEGWAPFVQVTGKSPIELLGLLRGEVTLVVAGMSPQGAPRAALSIELGDAEAEILDVVRRLRTRYEEDSGSKLATRKMGATEATIWPTPAVSWGRAVVGGHLVLALDARFLGELVAAHEGKAPAAREGGLLGPELQKRISLGADAPPAFIDMKGSGNLPRAREEVLAFVDVDGIKAIFLGPSGVPADRDGATAFRAIGIDGLTAVAFTMGFREGGAEWAAHVGIRKGTQGVLGILRDGFLPLPDAVGSLRAHRRDAGRHPGGPGRPREDAEGPRRPRPLGGAEHGEAAR